MQEIHSMFISRFMALMASRLMVCLLTEMATVSLITRTLYEDHSPDPKEYFGLSSDFRYKKWSVGFVARASLGNYVYNNVASSTGIQRNILNPLGYH